MVPVKVFRTNKIASKRWIEIAANPGKKMTKRLKFCRKEKSHVCLTNRKASRYRSKAHGAIPCWCRRIESRKGKAIRNAVAEGKR